MCQRCGCHQFISQGKEVILKRVIDIVRELRLTPANVDAYEDTEAISSFIAPFAAEEDEVYQTASWISGLHRGVTGWSNRDERYQAYVRAFRDTFARLPIQGDPKQIATTYHQLEQLARELSEVATSSINREVREAVHAVNHVHDDRTRSTRLKERYGL